MGGGSEFPRDTMNPVGMTIGGGTSDDTAVVWATDSIGINVAVVTNEWLFSIPDTCGIGC